MIARDTTRSTLSTFQRLAIGTTAATYLLILVGGLVRASGAGLGCPDWPRCFGSWIPPLSAADLPPEFDRAEFNPVLMWTEYLNRLLGVTVGLLILATLISAIRHHRRTPRILWPTAAAFVLVGFEGWLGGVVVAQELAAWIVTAHLVVALVIVSLLLYATVYAFFIQKPEAQTRPSVDRHRKALTWTTMLLILATLLQVAMGAQVRGGIDAAFDRGVARQQALGTVGAVDRWHRDWSLAVFSGVLVLLLVAWSRHSREVALVRTVYVIVALALAQIALGVSLAYLSLTPPAQIAHLTTASLLLGAETVLFLFARWLPPDRRSVGG